MIRNEENHRLIDHLLEELEAFGLEIGAKLGKLESDKKDYLFFSDVFEQLNQSKIDFCSTYFSLSEEGKDLFQKKLLSLFKDKDIVDNILQEIINFYYLNEYGLLEEEVISSQKDVAMENLETLATKIEKYLNDTHYDFIVSSHDRLSNQMDSLVLLGSILEEDDSLFEDIDFLEDTLQQLHLTFEEKRQLLFDIIHYNHSIYQKRMEEKRENDSILPTDELEELKDNPFVSEDCLARINELLSQKDVIKRIVDIINDEFTMVINLKAPSAEDKEQIESSLSIAREDLMDSMMQNHEMTPEQALDDFFQKYDETARRKRELIAQLTEFTLPSSLPVEGQKKIIKSAFDYLEKHISSINDMSKKDKEKVRQYMMGLFQNVENRKMMYDSGMLEAKDVLEREVAYEISIYKELLEAVPEEDSTTYAKIYTKLQEIIECANIDHEVMAVEDEIGLGHLFFLMDDEKTSSIESDIGVKEKGISHSFYGDIRNQLLNIEGRSTHRISIAQPSNSSLKGLKKNGVQYTFNPKIKTFFIPVGKRDAIVVGTGFLNGKDVFKDQDRRVRKYQDQIDQLRERLASPDTYTAELEKALTIRNRIMSQLDSKELDDMFEELPKSDSKKGKKK